MKLRQIAAAAVLLLCAVAAYALPQAWRSPDLAELLTPGSSDTGGLLELGLAALSVGWFVLNRRRG
jgi:hypothetical protein